MTKSDHELQQRYEDCVDQCADSLYRVAFRLTGNRTLSHELVQETYLNAWKSLASLSDPGKMKGWMFAILRNQYTKLIRKETRSVRTTDQIDQVAPSPGVQSETTDVVQAAIAMLDPKHRMPVLLVSMEGLSVDEAAEVLEVPRGTILSRLHRGREKLKRLLKREGTLETKEQTP